MQDSVDIKRGIKRVVCMDYMVFDLSTELTEAELPSGWAFIALRSDDGTLWCGFSARPWQRLQQFIKLANEDAVIGDLMRYSREYVVNPCSEAIYALIECKIHVHEHHPPFQQQLRPYSKYVYLGLDAWRFPFVSIQEHTNADWTYAGPFRDRFFLADVLDCIARIVKLPSCNMGVWPCERLGDDLCRGWCLNLDETKAPDPSLSLEKLDALLKESYLLPNNGILELVRRHRDEYFESLDFEKASLLDDEIYRLEKYRDWMRFLASSKNLDYDAPGFKVRNGLLSECVRDGHKIRFPVDSTKFRPNEALALNLAQVDEAKVLYDHYIKLQKE
jgi:excinuclease UvrABC nuclease subunit